MEAEVRSSVNSQVTELCRQYDLRQHERLQSQEMQKTKFKWMVVTIVAVAFAVLFFFVLRRVHRKKLKSMEHVIEAKDIRYSAQMSKLRHANIRLKEKNSLLAMQQVDVQPKKIPLNKRPAREYEALLQESVCMDLRHRFVAADILTNIKPSCYAHLAITEKQKILLIEAFDRHCPNFLSGLQTAIPT